MVAMCIASFTVTANATENRIYFKDGSYYIVWIESNGVKATGTKTGSKNYTYYSNSGTALWNAKLTGAFTYSGSNAVCTASSCDITVWDSNWNVISKSTSKSGNEALGTATMSRKVLGVTIEQKTANLSLSCDANGNLS